MLEQLFYVFLCFAYPFAFIAGFGGGFIVLLWLIDKLD